MEKEVAGLAGCGSSMPERTAVDIRVEYQGISGTEIEAEQKFGVFRIACLRKCMCRMEKPAGS